NQHLGADVRQLLLLRRIASEADPILIEVRLVGVVGSRAVVGRVRDPVVVVVRVAGIADAVAVLAGVGAAGKVRAQVAGVAHAVEIAVGLVRIGNERAVVLAAADGNVHDPVTVFVGVARIAEAVAVRVLLPWVGDGVAIVDRIHQRIAVAVVAVIALAV